MAYLALYRRYRPAGFDKIIGQDNIVKILKAQIESKSIGHAYLFCGARGTGKTSAAKIFAKAINCLNPVNGSPCNICEVCKALGKGSNMDILEIDAASNNKVEEVRDIREKVQYPPVSGKYKVYIIDEVHMLTDSAFNALLKTLEEPPRHAVFILATTEVYKLPATILSRCMRFDFKLVPQKTIANLLKEILNDIGKPYEEAAVQEIARAGEGSVRDALSIADMCVSYSDNILKFSDVAELLSASDRGKTTEFVNDILSGDTGKMLEEIDVLSSAGKSITVLNKDVITYLRDITVIKSCKTAREILTYPDEIFDNYLKSTENFDINKILRCLELFSSIETELRYSLHPRIIFEAAAVKAANPQLYESTQALGIRVKELEKIIKNLSSGILPPVKAETPKIQAVKIENTDEEPLPDMPPSEEEYLSPQNIKKQNADIIKEKPVQNILQPEKAAEKTDKIPEKLEINENIIPKAVKENASAVWGNVIRKLRQSNTGLLYTLCSELTAEIDGSNFIIKTENDMGAEILNKPKNYGMLKSIINADKEYNVIIRKGFNDDKNKKEDDLKTLNELSGGKLIIKE